MFPFFCADTFLLSNQKKKKKEREILRREKEEPPPEAAASASSLQLGAGTAQTGSEAAPAAWL